MNDSIFMINMNFNNKYPWVLIALLAIISCQDRSDIPEMPESNSTYAKPTLNDFSFSDPLTIEWDTLVYPNLDNLPKTKYNLDKIEAKPFSLNEPNPVNPFTDSTSFDFGSLPSKDLKIEDWPKLDLNITTKELGQPEIIETGTMTTQTEFSRGILELEQAFGISEQLSGLYEDKDGFLWFGGINNLYKYDYDKLYKYGSNQGLNFTRIITIVKDNENRLWIGTDSGLFIIDFMLNLSFEIKNIPNTGGINVIKPLNNGEVLIGLFGSGYYFIDLENNTMKLFGPEQGLLNSDFLVAKPLETDNELWLGSAGGIDILNFNTNRHTQITDENILPNSNVMLIFKDLKNRIWISTFGGSLILRTKLDQYDSFFRGDIGLSSAFQNNDSIIWLGTTNGVIGKLNLDQSTGTLHLTNQGINQIIYNLFISKQGQLWASKVVNTGIYVLDLNGANPGNYSDEDGLTNKRVWVTLPRNDGKIWIGTYEGIDIYDPETNTIKNIGIDEGLSSTRNNVVSQIEDDIIWSSNRSKLISIINTQNQTISKFQASFMEESDGIATVFKSKSGYIWIGSNEGFIYKLDPKEELLLSMKLPNPQAGLNIDNIVENKSGEIFFNGDFQGVYKIGKDGKTYSKIIAEDPDLIEQIFTMDIDNRNNLWLGGFTGVHKVDFNEKTVITFTTDQGLPANDVYAVKHDNKKIYAGSSQGLSIIQAVDTTDAFKIVTIDRTDGLRYVDFAQNSLSIDKDGRIWAGVENEILTVINPVEIDTINIKTAISGINLFDKPLHFNAPYGNKQTWIGNDTIWSVDRSSYTLKSDSESHKTNYTFSELDPKYLLPKNLQLAADQNYLSFRYHRPQFGNPVNLKYSYILEGIDKVWSTPTTETTSENYRDLPPGEYSFKVTALGSNNTWSEPSEFNFTIVPPWWQTLWARLLFFILFIGLLWSIIWYRGRWLKKENRLLEEKVSHRTRQLKTKINELKSTQNQLIQSEKMASLGELTAGIAHEIQNPLNFVNNFSEINQELIAEMHDELKAGNMEEALLIANDIKENEQKIYHHGKRADSIVKGMLQHSRNHSGEKLPTDINALCDEYLRLAYHGLRAKDKSFNATLESDFDNNLNKVLVVPQDIGRVILNIINNALFAIKDKKLKTEDENYKPTVKVVTENGGQSVFIKIIDNGNGIPDKVRDKIFQPFFTTKSAGEGTGLGLSMSYDIIKAHGGELFVESKEGVGTTFKIELPIS